MKRRIRLSSSMIVALMIFALLVSALLSSSMPAARARAYVAPAAPPVSDDKTIVASHQFVQPNGTVIPDPSPSTFIDRFAMANIARYFAIGGESYVALLNGNTGKLRVHRLTNGQDVGQIVFDWEHPILRCSGAGIAPDGGKLYLFLHSSVSGDIMRYPLEEDGSIDFDSRVIAHSGWKDMNLFSVYKQGAEWRLFALDTWTGKVRVGDITGREISEDNWTPGYTSVDHLYVNDRTTYRLLYKAMGDPYKALGESGDSSGLFVIQKVSADGLNAGNTQAILLPSATSSVNTAENPAGWSNIRFITMDDFGVPLYSVFFYNRKTGDYMQMGFNPQTGTLGFFQTAQGNIGSRWTDIDPYIYEMQARLITVNYEDVRPFYYDEVERMALEIHRRLATKVVGYQLMVSQSGRLIYSRGWGKKRLDLNDDAPEQMTTHTKLDLGSISKMITAVTLLKLSSLASSSPYKPIDLDAAISNYLDPDDYPEDSWVKQMTVKNLLTHTTGMKADSCESNVDDLKMDCGDFFSARQSKELFNEQTRDYKWHYNNSNIAAARKVIEYVTGAKTSEEIVNKTFELWAKDAFGFDPYSFNVSCFHDPDVYYFASCHGADDCYDFQDQPWQQSKLIDGWSASCSAGGWAASSRNMLEFLHAIRYKRIFGDSPAQELLTDTGMTSGGVETALSWDPPWNYDSAEYLGKGGANGDNDSDAAFHNYITRLPDNADAVLLINTAAVDPSSLLRSAYKFSVNPGNAMPLFNSEDTFNTGETVAKIALNETPTNSIYTSGDYVTAARDNDGKLLLTLWDVHTPGNGQIERVEDVTDISIRDVEVTDGLDFVTAVRDADSRLKVIAWSKAFGLHRNGEATGDEVSQISVTKAASDGVRGRAVTAARNKDGKLQLDLWEYDNLTEEVTLTDTQTLGVATDITIETLEYVNSLDQDARVVTGMRNSNGKLQVDVWDVLANGQLDHKDGDSFSTVTGAQSANKIAIDPRGAGSDFFKGVGFLTASIDKDGKLQIVTWETDALGNITRVDDHISEETVTSLDVTRATTTARNDSGYLLMTRWTISEAGDISPQKGDTLGGAINQVVAAGNVVTAYRSNKDKLYLINWQLMQ